MMLPWSTLVQIREEVPIVALNLERQTPLSSLQLIGENPQSTEGFRLRGWFRTDPHQFFRTRGPLPASEPSDTAHFSGFAWAASDGTFAWVLTGDRFFDDGASQVPPCELLLDGHSYGWHSVVRLGRAVESRFFHDYSNWVGLREVEVGRFTFYYRSEYPGSEEPPMCIIVIPFRRPDDIGAEPGASPMAAPRGAQASRRSVRGRHR